MIQNESRTTSRAPGPRTLAVATGIAVGALLSGCGGSSNSPAPAPAPPAPAPAPMSVTGTAASGLAMAGAAIEIKCTGGTGTATAAADGSYSASITGATLPCMVRATSSDGTLAYHAALTGSGTATSAVINVTPLTELILAIAAGDPTQVDATFTGNATLPGALGAALAAAEATLAGALAAAGIDISAFDPVTTALSAATSTTATGDAQDQAIDTLMADLAVNKSGLVELATVLDTAVSTTTAQQEAATLLAAAPVVSQCAYARPGTYWWINHNGGLTTITLDSTLSAVTIADTNEQDGNNPETDTLTWASGCQATFTQQNTAVQQVTFTSGGEFAAGNLANGTVSGNLHIAIPQQKVALADLAGDWNFIEYDSRENTQTTFSETNTGIVTLDAQGHLTCSAAEIADGCVQPTLTANADGTFTATASAGSMPVLVFRGANGKLNFIALQDYPNGGGLIIAAPVATAVLPANGSTSVYVQYQLSGIPATGSTHNWASFDIDTFTYTVSAVDTTARTATRSYSTKDGALFDLVDVVDYDQPSTGFRLRPALSYTDAGGTTYNKPNSYILPLGTGMSVFADGADGTYSSATATSTSSPFFGVSVPLN